MEQQKCMNHALEYIEDNLAGTMDYSVAAQFMNCSEWEFRRLFSFMAQVPLSEYIRRRRLTLAAADIQKGEKIIDAALRYGYESQAAFSRAFRQWHGFAPSMARKKEIVPKAYPRLAFKLILMEGSGMKKKTDYRPNIIGSGEVGYAVSLDMNKETIHQANRLLWDTTGNELIGTTALPFYGAFVSEEKCKLFGDVNGKKVLEIGCGTGHSLEYVASRGAKELWGLDMAENQLHKAYQFLEERHLSANLVCAAMEEECDIPMNYFDIVYSVYAIGWTTDLGGTFGRIASYLKQDGIFIFSWSHPIHKCVAAENDQLVFKKNYFDESWYSVSLGEGTLALADRKLSTYVNALVKAGFVIEEMIEESDEDILNTLGEDNDFGKKARMLPVTFIIKARKPQSRG